MMLDTLAKSYAPAESERDISARWDGAGAFHADPGDAGDPYCILIPPPNVTAALHLGHAFNNTLQDLLIRYHRMRGYNTLWMPGTDHAGIATQTVVENRLEQQGIKRRDLGREAFIERVQAWKDEYEATILEQLKAMGCSCDWPRVRFTMDPMCARAVREAFFRLFADGLIYRGKYLVNWDPITMTALADDEVEMKEVDGHMWYLRYPLVDADGATTEEHVVVATTRPETMLGDTAVAMNPRDPNASALLGRHVRLPLVNRVVPLIADDYVVLPGEPDNPMSAYATGYLKVTPAHDPNDWEIGLRHGLQVINVMAPDATMSRDHGWPAEEFESGQAAEVEPLLGLSREDARERVVEWFREHDLLAEVRDYRHSVGHSYRSHEPIEPYLSDQWYVRVTDQQLSGEALRAMCDDQHEGAHPPRADGSPRAGDGELRFFPPRYARTFQAWHENLRDWCISRQLWWGHRIPVWTLHTPDAGAEADRWRAFEAEHEGRVSGRYEEGRVRFCIAAGAEELERELEAAGFEQDPDVLDTWFSSGLWPLSTMGWPDPDSAPETIGLLDTFNPSSVLCTARDIITLWVSRMVMFNRYFRNGTLPFRHVYVHPMIQDGVGQRMSKSLGNGVDPRDIIHSHGADALRFVLTQLATSTQDVRLPVDMLCPHCEQTFEPEHVTSPAGYTVSAPRQACPKCKGRMLSALGAAMGHAEDDGEMPTARNSSRKFDLGRNFANKLWNAVRFSLGKLEQERHGGAEAPRHEGLSLIDRWIVGRLRSTLDVIDEAIAGYQFHQYAEAMYDFVWRDFCDWYLEAIKPTVGDDPTQQQVLRTIVNAIVRMLHPICPFVTETLWPHIQATGEPGLPGVTLAPAAQAEVLATAPWPRLTGEADDEAGTAVERLQTLTMSIRNLRAEHNVPPKKRVVLHAPGSALTLIDHGGGLVQTLAGLESVTALTDGETPQGAIPFAFEGDQLFVGGLVEAVDVEAERARLARVCEDKEKAAERFRTKLDNKAYVSKAPAHLVAETREKLAEAESDLAAARQALDALERGSA